MIEGLPTYINLTFIVISLITGLIFYKASHYSKTVLAVMVGWLAVQGFIAYSLFYTVTDTIPPRFILQAMPPLVLMIVLFVTPKGRAFLDGLDMTTLTYLHTIRVVVEFVLLWLFLQGQVPEIMTFEGRNFDIIAGITAPFIAYFGLTCGKISKQLILVWNVLSVLLLVNIIITGILSVPTTFQQFGLEQPNVALGYFPFVWLASFVVPLVLLSHFASIRQLIRGEA